MESSYTTKAQLRASLQRVANKIESAEDKIDVLSGVANGITARIEAAEGDISSLQTQVDGMDIPAPENLVTIPGGGTMTVPDGLGPGPYTLELTPETNPENGGGQGPVSASDVSYDGTESGAQAETVQSALDFLYSVALPSMPPEMHRKNFRGKNLGNAMNTAQKTATQNGTFYDLWLGDYWVKNGVNYRIVDMDYWWNCGDVAFTEHHLVIMPDTNLGADKQMNTTNTTEGGYVGSLMYTSNMNEAKAMCTAAFGENILSHREYLVNAVANGKPSGGSWLDSTIELPNECMISGHPHFAPACDGTTFPHIYTIDKTQLALFAVAPKFITTRQNYWLRDVVSAAHFARVTGNGGAGYADASISYVGVRPVFPVGVN